jgi:aldehyde dehydrogenase (NAD+)
MTLLSSSTFQMSNDQKESPHRINEIFRIQSKQMISQGLTSASYRIQKLKRLKKAILSRRQEIRDALTSDFQKSEQETDLSEIFIVTSEIDYVVKHLRDWMQSRAVSTPLLLFGTRSEIRYQSKGNVLVIAPWNFPFNLSLAPAVISFAAGNCTIIKPSEFTPATNRVMQTIVSEVFEESEMAILTGDSEVAQQLLSLPFNHVFFTGSTRVGKIVMTAAAKHLASVTLELGGKSPVWVDSSANLKDAAMRIAWGKWFNAGQTCIAPDYIMAEAGIVEALKAELNHWVGKFYSSSPNLNRDYTGIIRPEHEKRLEDLGADAAIHGKMKPSILIVNPDHQAMREEIFGPVLPILPVTNATGAIEFINRGERPLSMYLFTNDRKTTEAFLTKTRAGGVAVNETLLHFFHKKLPFGGVNSSGMGRYHGFHGFSEFSNPMGVLRQSFSLNALHFILPPFSNLKKRIITLIMRLF